VKENAKNAINWNIYCGGAVAITFLILVLLLAPLLLLGLLLNFLLIVAYIYYIIKGILKAYNGEIIEYPIVNDL